MKYQVSLTLENNMLFSHGYHMWKDHRCYGYMINRTFGNKKCIFSRIRCLDRAEGF